jgi:hypothetical protein
MRGRPRIDLVGKTFGKLTVVSFSEIDEGGNVIWRCKCECGELRDIRGTNLTGIRGTKSCGCLKVVTQQQTHCQRGHEFTPENTIETLQRRTCRICKVAGDSKHWVENKETLQAYRREWHLNSIGWTTELLESTLKAQNGKCAICPKVLTFEDKMCNSRACADHKHVIPPKPRGLLCSPCNSAIGLLQDSPALLREAAKYVEKFQ